MDWQRIDRLRKIFLTPKPTGGIADYWDDAEIVELYDETLAQRIMWKWQAVWSDLDARGWTGWKNVRSVGDWGCGTGIATRSWLAQSGETSRPEVFLFDRSAAATGFATAKISQHYPSVQVRVGPIPPVDLILISHVTNELTKNDRVELLRVVKQAKMVVWVEPGTSDGCTALLEMREILRKKFKIVAPCARQSVCPLQIKRGKDWCHQFAEPPGHIFHDPFWSEFSRRLKIDLRSLPLSYLALVANDAGNAFETHGSTIGAARRLKHGDEILVCGQEGGLSREHAEKLPRLNGSLWSVKIAEN